MKGTYPIGRLWPWKIFGNKIHLYPWASGNCAWLCLEHFRWTKHPQGSRMLIQWLVVLQNKKKVSVQMNLKIVIYWLQVRWCRSPRDMIYLFLFATGFLFNTSHWHIYRLKYEKEEKKLEMSLACHLIMVIQCTTSTTVGKNTSLSQKKRKRKRKEKVVCNN